MTLPVAYPAIAFVPSLEKGAEPGHESVESHHREIPYIWGPLFRQGQFLNSVLVDSKGQCWRIVEIVDLGLTNPIRKLVPFLRRYGMHRVRVEVVEEPAIPFEQLIDRVCAAMRANPDDWRDDEAIAGENGPPQGEAEMMERRIGKVRRAKTIKRLITILDN
jgi:hypothetical protein